MKAKAVVARIKDTILARDALLGAGVDTILLLEVLVVAVIEVALLASAVMPEGGKEEANGPVPLYFALML